MIHAAVMSVLLLQTPVQPGQGAFGAVQEIVTILENDPETDWSKVDLRALREHLVDMNRLFLEAEVVEKPIEAGIEMRVSGEGRTRDAIQRMVAAHAREIQTHDPALLSELTVLPDGVLWVVTTDDARTRARVRGLGFFGLMASGRHHQAHHLAIARGEHPHGMHH